jgi:hypothetical protein
MIPDEWRPPPCKHGAQAIVEQEFIEYGGGGPFKETMPGRRTLTYDCPTPHICVKEAYDNAPRQEPTA